MISKNFFIRLSLISRKLNFWNLKIGNYPNFKNFLKKNHFLLELQATTFSFTPKNTPIFSESGGRLSKRVRYSDSRDNRDNVNTMARDEDDYDRPARRTLQSSVVMPTIETKSRDAVLSEMKKRETKEENVR